MHRNLQNTQHRNFRTIVFEAPITVSTFDITLYWKFRIIFFEAPITVSNRSVP